MKSPARIFISVRPSNPRRLSTKRFAINDVVYRSARRAFKDVNEKTNLKLLRNRSTVRTVLDTTSPSPPRPCIPDTAAPERRGTPCTHRPPTDTDLVPAEIAHTHERRQTSGAARRNHDRTIAIPAHGARSMRSGSRTRPRPPIDPHDRMHDGTSHCLERVQFSTTASATPTGATRGRHTQWSSRRLARSPTLLPVARPITTLHAHHNCTVASLELLRSLILI